MRAHAALSMGERNTSLIRCRGGRDGPWRLREVTPQAIDQVWLRLRAGQAAKPTARELGLCTARCAPICCVAAGSSRCRVGGRRAGCGWRSVRRSPGVWPRAGRTGRSRAPWGGRLRRSAVRSQPTAGPSGTGQLAPTSRPGPARPVPRRAGLTEHPLLRAIVEEKLFPTVVPAADRRLAQGDLSQRPGDAGVAREHLPHLYVQSRGALRRELTAYLRTGRVIRRPKGARLPDGRGGRPNTAHISARPAEAADRAVPGHWEGDLVFGKGMSPVATPGRALDPVPDAGRPARREPQGRRRRGRPRRRGHHLRTSSRSR